jgi:hypothetical protein
VKTFIWVVAFYGSEAWTIGKNRSEMNRGLRDLVLEEDVENKMDGKCEERGGIQKNQKRKKLYGAPYTKEEQGGLAT